ncbi:MAG: V-type ATPase subunit [Cenarchaeum sp. SB0665_bin_23]|nr:V-type ATPase subunit [Cenarchaeum sp. SB0665_bin_23]MXZ94256.1 V-type ATPase subunit [Cenarchaeum sp. SB0666_bin_15]MYB47120.1 V-type ATPase subunit [Cenarchaeum sp. SB0662_bin_33]MYC79465.1 V-type ATPase subunit [Cenarchaeum sp. SB0661_bin_35]MYD58818.1 V-type ATPase subunit [Cenarchaeum sp. SB0678_bin_8]MYG32460.1 V-type ATPase subunit [Cenarchaeum sp. SB0677_bin_16]MYI51289.1 V-type ATPase subunit [Cenarchaeum sp. SB0673_bin_9]MYJ28304.1 V-type ATPase subunit [Cenarchaeum sp. SB0672_b
MGNSKNVYASVKSYSQRGKLFIRDDYQTLAESRNLDELITRLRNTKYEPVMADIPKPYTAHGIESVIRGHLASLHYGITKTVGNSPILDAYYMRFIVTNLKAILKGKVLGKAQEDIESYINLRAEELVKQRDVVIKALVAKDLEEAVASLSSTKFGDDVSRAAAAYSDVGNIQVFDTYFDKIVYQNLSRALRQSRDRHVIKIVSPDLDSYNLLSVIRGKFWGLDESTMEDLLVPPTQSAPRDLLSKMMAAGDVRDALNEVSNSKYRHLIPQTENEMDAVAEFERALEREIYTTSIKSFTRMFSFATIIGITKLTAYEIRNLAAISFAVEQGIDHKTVMSKLILPTEA